MTTLETRDLPHDPKDVFVWNFIKKNAFRVSASLPLEKKKLKACIIVETYEELVLKMQEAYLQDPSKAEPDEFEDYEFRVSEDLKDPSVFWIANNDRDSRKFIITGLESSLDYYVFGESYGLMEHELSVTYEPSPYAIYLESLKDPKEA